MIRAIQKSDDLERIAQLIYATDDFLFPYIFGRGKGATDKLKALIALEDNSFSHRFIRGFFDQDGVCQGIAITFHAKNQSNDRDFTQVFSGLNALGLGLKLLPIQNLLNPRIGQSLYLQNLSVHESTRGQGIGKALLKDFYETAIEAGFDTVSLDVSLSNEGAMRLYLNEGFKRVKKRRILGLFPVMYYCEKNVQY